VNLAIARAAPRPQASAPAGSAERPLAAAGLAALGIVFGDLGTSPLYTFQTVVGVTGGHLSPPLILGILSLIVWALILIVSVKYCALVMRADNDGEGGILALMSLVAGDRPRRGLSLVTVGLFGAALLYGDGVITPAISVLSALEGVNAATPALQPYVMPAAVAILVALFAAQTLGTARIGAVFGPLMLLWFVAIGAIGLAGVVRHPAVLAAINPVHAVRFLAAHGWGSFAVLGGVFLAVTGAEALYADMGHFGRRPIQLAWYCLVLPALLLSYAGQSALLLDQPGLSGNPFFRSVPRLALYPMVALATLATIIASQAIITGVFSLTRQAIQLGWFPGLRIRQTSDESYGQIYVPVVNWVMMLATVALTVGFRGSDRLAGAYGTAVSTTMLLTTLLLFVAMRARWRWPAALAVAVSGAFLIVDAAFFSANLLKVADGGWIPLLIAAALFTLMATWGAGIAAIRARLAPLEMPAEALVARLQGREVPRVPGTAVFLSRTAAAVSPLLARHVEQFGALAETLVSLTVRFERTPRLPAFERVAVREIGGGLWQVTVRFGFLERPSLRAALASARDMGCPVDLDAAVYFGAHDAVVRRAARPRLAGWQRLLFGFMYRNAVHMVDRFELPPSQFVEIGRQVEL
jgi:KUP system potassium uptake protein